MNDIQIFNNPDFGDIRTVIIDGEPWFIANDIGKALGYADPRTGAKKLVDDEDKLVVPLDSAGQTRQMTVINESGLYAMIFGSTLDTAKTFKRWVTSDVLPQIRKTGSYGLPKEPIALPTTPTEQIKLLAQGHVELAEKVETVSVNLDAVKSDLEQFKEDCPLFPVEAEQIVNAAKRRGVIVMGGKDSEAYHDRSIVQSVYRDMYSQLHRNFDISTYKALSRGQLTRAIGVIENYELPIALADKVRAANAQITLF